MNYRHEARQHLQGAKNELSANSDERLKFAALELRMAMESLTYDRASAFKDEFPPQEYGTWQPKKVMAVLLEIDPRADKDSSLAIGGETVPGQPASSLHALGSEKVLNMSVLRKHYDALGSYLHVPTMKQALEQTPIDFMKFRARCEELATFVEEVLASRIFNVTLGNFSHIDCANCHKPIRKRLPTGQKEVIAECYECFASYTIVTQGDGQVVWEPQQHEIECANPNCHAKTVLWDREVKVGACWKCNACQGRNVVCMGVRYAPEPQEKK